MRGRLDRVRAGLVFLALEFSFASAALGMEKASAEGGVISQANNAPVAGAQVTLRSHLLPGGGVTVETGDSGEFRFPVLEPGEYRLEVKAEGYFSVEQVIALRPRQPLVLTVVLVPRRAAGERAEVRASAVEVAASSAGSSQFLTRQGLENLPSFLTRDLPALVEHVAPGAVLGHDNFLHVRGNELSLHQFINGVAFLENPHAHFSPGFTPRIFETVNVVTGGFPAEFGNRFGGILDITTRSGRSLEGHGLAVAGAGTGLHHDASFEFGGEAGRLGYYFYAGGVESGRFLNPPTPREIHDRGYSGQTVAQLDYEGGRNLWKLLLIGSGSNFELPNAPEEAAAGRDAARRLRSETAILSWQRIFSPRSLLASSIYQRSSSDRLVPTSDPLTPFGEASRTSLTTGAKMDFTQTRDRHTLKAGLDLTLLNLRESFTFDPRIEHPEDPPHEEQVRLFPGRAAGLKLPALKQFDSAAAGVESFAFRGRDRGGLLGLYVQDSFSPAPRLTLHLGARWDQINLVNSDAHLSPRAGLAYQFPALRSVVHFTYNRFFTPPPVEYLVLANSVGPTIQAPERFSSRVRPYTQDYFEVGWKQELRPQVSVEFNAYHHRGRHAFELSEIANTRVFLPTNFNRARARGAEVVVSFDDSGRTGLSARLQYAAARAHFLGPISGGFAAEDLTPGQRVLPAFDQTHTASAHFSYRSRWRGFRTGWVLRYGSGTPVEKEFELDGEASRRFVRLPQHFSADFSAALTLWHREPQRLDFELNVTNLSNNIYRIAKESETTPIQYAPRRGVAGRLAWHF